MRSLALGLVIALVSTFPLPAAAQRHGGGGGGHPSGGGAPHVSAPVHVSAPAPVHVSAPQPQTRPGGFDLHEDYRTQPATAPSRPTSPDTSRRIPVGTRQPIAAHRPTLVGNLGYGGQLGARRVIRNPRYQGNAWGWNRGVTWNPAPSYYGGGFWGPFALAAVAADAFGEIAYDDGTLESYQVEPDSPGAQLLENYQLTQVPCGPPDLVVIFGPDNSVICANPNDVVAAGEYQLDPSELTIVSLS